MSKNELTQVQFKQQGLLYQNERAEEQLLREFFNYDDQNGAFKKDIRSCSLVQQKGANFQFTHKSIQEFFIAADLYQVLVQSNNFDTQIMNIIIELLSKEENQNQDCLEFLKNLKQKYSQNYNQIGIKSLLEKQKQIYAFEQTIDSVAHLIKIIKIHGINSVNYSTETYTETRQYLIKKIQQEVRIIEFSKFLQKLIKIQLQVDLMQLIYWLKCRWIQQTKILKIQEQKIIIYLENVNGINLNGAQLFGCNWQDLKINDLYQLDGHSNDVCFSSDGNTLASGSDDKSIRLWDVKTGQQKAKLDGHEHYVMSVCFSPDGNTLASGSDDKSIRLWDVKTGQQKAKLDGHSNCVNSVCFSPDGNTLASGSEDKSIRLWDVKTGQQKAKLDGHSNCINSVCFSPDGNTLASGSDDKSIRLWDVKTGQQKAKLDGHSSYVYSVCFSPDGNTLASGSDDKSIRLWDVKTGQQKAKLDGHSSYVRSVCFSPDGNTLASGSDDKSIRLWDVKTGQQKAKLDGHSSYVRSVCFSPDGNTLASGSDDKSIRLWDVKTGQQKAKLDGHSSYVYSVCFSPDGNTLASGSDDKSIRLWDVKTGQQKAKLNGHTSIVQSVCFSPDGNTLASGSYDNSIRLWEIKKKYCSDYRFIKMQVKNTRYPFLNTPLQQKNIIQNLDTFNIMVYPDFNFSRFKKVFYKKSFPFFLGELLEQHLINLKTNLYQTLIQIYFNILLVSNIC
ncbi:unnamed protein product [Paramecium pentaurelia]|uniref:EML-like second beta-propeller domain-containing protein n=1 Tax=Paramecium pentaurelia TaxID=43138 RepID=A0A8S1VJY0_9CILI|nr:unnamed protein product [Paramecium pentaurelia]